MKSAEQQGMEDIATGLIVVAVIAVACIVVLGLAGVGLWTVVGWLL